MTHMFQPVLPWEEFHAIVERSLTEMLKRVELAEASTSPDEDTLLEFAREDFCAAAALLSDEPETDGAMAFADEFRKFILRYRGIGIKVFERFCLGEGSSITILWGGAA